MNDTEMENDFPQMAFVDILLDIAREDKEFRDYLRRILEGVPDDQPPGEAKEAINHDRCD